MTVRATSTLRSAGFTFKAQRREHFPIEVELVDPIEEAKAKISSQEGISPNQYRLPPGILNITAEYMIRIPNWDGFLPWQ
jgi:hypothetical protein